MKEKEFQIEANKDIIVEKNTQDIKRGTKITITSLNEDTEINRDDLIDILTEKFALYIIKYSTKIIIKEVRDNKEITDCNINRRYIEEQN